MKTQLTTKDNTDKPPFLGTWKNIYWLVGINLVVLIVLFYAFTQYFS